MWPNLQEIAIWSNFSEKIFSETCPKFTLILNFLEIFHPDSNLNRFEWYDEYIGFQWVDETISLIWWTSHVQSPSNLSEQNSIEHSHLFCTDRFNQNFTVTDMVHSTWGSQILCTGLRTTILSSFYFSPEMGMIFEILKTRHNA